MSAVGFTPIQLYHSTTATTIPSSGNLANGELGLNIADMKLYAKNSSGVVTLLASSSGASATVSSVAVSGGTTGLTTSGGPITTSGTITFAGTLIAANGGTGFSSYTTGDMLFASGATAISKLSLGTTNFVLTAGASAPQYVAQSTLAVGTATNLAGGSAGASPYQTGSGATTFLSLGTSGHVLTAGASAPQYVAQNTLAAGSASNITGGAANQVVFQSGASTTSFVSVPTTGGTVLGWTGSAFAWVNAPAATSTTNIAGGSAGVVPFQSGVGVTSFTAVGTAGYSLTSQGTGTPTWSQVSLTAGVTGTLPIANGGTGTTSTTFVNLTTNVTGTLPIANGGTNSTDTPTAGGVGYGTGTAHAYTGASTAGYILTSGGAGAPAFIQTLPVANGGTGLTAGTSGGILAYTASGTLASSGALTQYGVVLGGGAGAVPTSTAVGTANQVLTSNGAGVAPTFQTLPSSGVSAVELFFYANANA